jgi:PAS domain S-box-containing protein
MQILSKHPSSPVENQRDKPKTNVQRIHKKASNLDALVENLDGFVWGIDTKMRYIILNNALRHLIKEVTGFDAKPGDKFLDVLAMLDPSKADEWIYVYQQAFEGKPQQFVQQFVMKEQLTFFEVSINPMRKGDSITGVSCFARNVTEAVMNSRKLQASEIRFRSLIENSSDITVVVDGTGNIVYGSPSIEKYFNHNPAEFTGTSAFQFVHPDDLGELAMKFMEVLSKPGESMPIKSRAYTKEGRLIWVEGIVTNLLETAGVNGIVCNFRDVTERKLTEKLVQESEDLYRNLFNKSPLPTWVCCTESLQFLEANEAAVQHYGYNRDEFLERTAFDITPVENHYELKELLTTGNIIQHQHLMRRHVKKNKEIIFVEVLAHTINYKGLNCYLIVANDITEKIRLRHELMEEKIHGQRETMQAAIGAQEKERAEIGRELHDNVKQILSTAKLCLEYGNSNAAEQQHMIKRASEMINTAIEEIRELSKSLIQNYEREIGLQLSIENLVESVRLGNRFNIKIDFALPDENKLDDKLKMTLFRIIQEQLNNILKHADASNITITVKQMGEVLSLCIVDDGKGFDMRQKRRGIGITNIINRTEIFNGHIKIDSAPGKGCRMLVNFKVTS